MLSMVLAVRKVSRKLNVWQTQSPKGCWSRIIPTKVAGMFKTVMRMLQKDKFMVKTPGTCRRISVLWTKHSSTNKFDNSETTPTTTIKSTKRISAKSMSHSGKRLLRLPAHAVDEEHLKPTMVLSVGSSAALDNVTSAAPASVRAPSPHSSASAVQRAERGGRTRHLLQTSRSFPVNTHRTEEKQPNRAPLLPSPRTGDARGHRSGRREAVR